MLTAAVAAGEHHGNRQLHAPWVCLFAVVQRLALLHCSDGWVGHCKRGPSTLQVTPRGGRRKSALVFGPAWPRGVKLVVVAVC